MAASIVDCLGSACSWSMMSHKSSSVFSSGYGGARWAAGSPPPPYLSSLYPHQPPISSTHPPAGPSSCPWAKITDAPCLWYMTHHMPQCFSQWINHRRRRERERVGWWGGVLSLLTCDSTSARLWGALFAWCDLIGHVILNLTPGRWIHKIDETLHLVNHPDSVDCEQHI